MITKSGLIGVAPMGAIIHPLTRIPMKWDDGNPPGHIGTARRLTKSIRGTFSVLSFDGEPHDYATYNFKHPIGDYIGFQIRWTDLQTLPF